MMPIHYDFLISGFCLACGLYVLWAIGAFTKEKYTPSLAGMTVSAGIVAWLLILLVSLSSIYETPPWAYTQGWKGSWAYTASRLPMAIMWLMALMQIKTYSPRCRKHVKARL